MQIVWIQNRDRCLDPEVGQRLWVQKDRELGSRIGTDGLDPEVEQLSAPFEAF